ncbi:hypothetical protein ScPMuIL_009590 [Solemya velum]
MTAIVEGEKVKFYPRTSKWDEYERELLVQFPDEVIAIGRYFDILKTVMGAGKELVIAKMVPKFILIVLLKIGLLNLLLPILCKYGRKTLKQVLDELTSNKELQLVLAYSFGDYGLPPGEAPFLLHCSVSRHYMGGAYYPRGGPSEIPLQMIPIIQKQGGNVLVKAPVTRILVDTEGRASAHIIRRLGRFRLLSATSEILLTPQILSKIFAPCY